MAGNSLEVKDDGEVPVVDFNEDTDEMFAMRAGKLVRPRGKSLVTADGSVGTAKFGDVQIPSDGEYSAPQPFANFLQTKVDLTSLIAKEQYKAIRSGNPTAYITNHLGQDSLDGAINDVLTAGGEVRVPEGTFLVPHKTISKWRTAIVANKGAVFRTNQATGDQIQFGGAFQDVIDLRFESTVPRAAGACVRALWNSTRINAENIESQGAFTLWQVDGHPTDPTQDRGIYSCRSPRAYDTVANGIAFMVSGGYVVHLYNPMAISNSALAPSLWPLDGIRVTGAADMLVDGSPQIIGARIPLRIAPPTGRTVASFTMPDGYMGTSWEGSLISGENGGDIVTCDIGRVWMGENGLVSSTGGLTVRGHHTGGIQGLTLTNTRFPLCQGNGFTLADGFVKSLQIIGGWADGCAGSGYAFLGGGWQASGIRSGDIRFGGNAVGVYIGAVDNFMLNGVLTGNVTNLANGAGTGATKVINVLS